jgi:hypothetical protein
MKFLVQAGRRGFAHRLFSRFGAFPEKVAFHFFGSEKRPDKDSWLSG